MIEIKKTNQWRAFFIAVFSLFFLSIQPEISFAYPPKNNLPPLINELSLQLPQPSFYPQSKNLLPPPTLSAQSAMVVDLDSQVPLFSKNASLKLPPASTTKIVSALVVLENYDLNQNITIQEIKTDGAKMGLKKGDVVSVRNLLYGMLINSGNDAAYALALNHPQGLTGFIEQMNNKAKTLYLNNSHFNDVTGLTINNHFSTSLDLSRLTTYALKNLLFRQIVSTQKTIVFDKNFKHAFELQNLNQLLGQLPGVLGVKTGFTETAGECLITYTERNGHKIITVVLNSQDRFWESKALIEWAFSNHSWIQPEAIAGT